jgi:hypothetical protein
MSSRAVAASLPHSGTAERVAARLRVHQLHPHTVERPLVRR